MLHPRLPLAAIVLCGGRSQRMGQPKHLMTWGNGTLCSHLCRVVGRVCSPVILVAAQQQTIPTLPSSVQVIRDELPDAGPRAAIACGLLFLRQEHPDAEVTFVTACDTPLLTPAVVSTVYRELKDSDAAIVFQEGFPHPLCAVYRTRVADTAKQLLISGERRLTALLERIRVREIPCDLLRGTDPELHCLKNVNTMDDYDKASAIARRDPELYHD
ncbi:MAG: molybdenum cofactor guanylyltransferase [Planctomyces sp.]